MQRRFFWSMVAVAVLTAVLGGVAAALLINRSVESSIREEFSRQATSAARLIEAEFIADAGSDRPRIRQGQQADRRSPGDILLVAAAVGGHDYVEATFIGPQGALDPLGDGTQVLTPMIPDIAALESPYRFDAAVDGGTVAAVAQPVRIGPRGMLVVVIGTDLAIVPWDAVAFRFAWAIALGIGVAALLAAAAARTLGRRLDPLAAAAVSVAAGDLEARADVGGDDEIAAVAAAFNDMAAELQAARGRERAFLQAVGHELRTPLTAIAGYAEAMEDGRVSGDDLHRVATTLGLETGRLSRLVEDLMVLSRLEAREFGLVYEDVDVAAHLGATVEAFVGRATDAGVDLVAAIEPTGSLVTDPDRIAQILANLLDNALRYTPAGGRVEVGVRRGDDGVVLTVSDTGAGIDPEDLPHVWERLYVASRYRPLRPGGSGLGLAIVRQLAETMGGGVAVSSRAGEGTVFTITLPAGPVARD